MRAFYLALACVAFIYQDPMFGVLILVKFTLEARLA